MSRPKTARKRSAPRASPWVELATGAAWVIGIAAALQLIHLLIGESPLGVAILGALVVDLAAGRAGLRWFEVEPAPPARAVARLAGVGAATALAVAALVLLGGVLLGRVEIEHGHPSLGIGLGVLRAGGLAIRDELLLRGLVLYFAARARVPSVAALVFASLTSPAAIALADDVSVEALALSAASGFFFAVLWQRTRCAVVPVAAHATWLLTTGVLLRGGVVDVFWLGGVLSSGTRASSIAAWIASAAFIGMALVLAPRLARFAPTPEARRRRAREDPSSGPQKQSP